LLLTFSSVSRLEFSCRKLIVRARRIPQSLFAWLPQLPPRTSAVDSLVVQGVVLRETDHGGLEVLLVHRLSPRAWEIPGGKPNLGEPYTVAVAREVLEECAITVEAVRHIATFRRSGIRPHTSPVFRCVACAGTPVPNEEAVAAKFHPIHSLPWGTFPWLREAISLAVEDLREGALAHAEPIERVQHLGVLAGAQALLIHMAGIARLRP
jgi:ADP-ribose pyrophosphatase YjhB (NUDIX family)